MRPIKGKVYLNGIHMLADDVTDLHEVARCVLGVDKSFFHLSPSPYYDIICPFKIKRLTSWIEKRNRVYDNEGNRINNNRNQFRYE